MLPLPRNTGIVQGSAVAFTSGQVIAKSSIPRRISSAKEISPVMITRACGQSYHKWVPYPVEADPIEIFAISRGKLRHSRAEQ